MKGSVMLPPLPHKNKPLLVGPSPAVSQSGAIRQLVIMVKVPVAGRVKTRLAEGIGAVRAAGFYRSALRATVARVARSPAWRSYLAVSPDLAVDWPGWPLDLPRIAQGPGDLGQRMQRILHGLPPGPTVIIGSDAPCLTATHVAEAFGALGSHDAVIGPAPDGGYWLIGLKRSPRVVRPFDGVRWSSTHTLEDTLSNLSGVDVARLDELDDVDEVSEFKRLGAHAGMIVPRACA